ncbi:MAG: hypothetical protein WA323_10525 [Candidatus Nitrosopolaris sp.]
MKLGSLPSPATVPKQLYQNKVSYILKAASVSDMANLRVEIGARDIKNVVCAHICKEDKSNK